MRTDTEPRNTVRTSAGWSIALGIVLIILGIIAIAAPFFASLTIGLFLGWLFIIGGIIQAVYAFRNNHRPGALVLKLLLGIVAIVAGIFLVTNPVVGVASLTLIVGIYFFIDGIFRVFLAFQLKPSPSWGWVLLNGILMIILGILIWSQWPFSAAWVLGVLVGIGLLFSGISTLAFAAAARQSTRLP